MSDGRNQAKEGHPPHTLPYLPVPNRRGTRHLPAALLAGESELPLPARGKNANRFLQCHESFRPEHYGMPPPRRVALGPSKLIVTVMSVPGGEANFPGLEESRRNPNTRTGRTKESPRVALGRKGLGPRRWRTERSGIGRARLGAGSRPWARRSVDLWVSTVNAPAISRRCGQVVVVSPILVQAAFDCALSSTVRGTPHTAGQGLLPGRRPFHQIPMEPPVLHHHRTIGLCRCCSGARTLARRVPTRPRVPRSGDFPQRSVVADTYHRQLPSTSWRGAEGGAGGNSLARGREGGRTPVRSAARAVLRIAAHEQPELGAERPSARAVHAAAQRRSLSPRP